MQRLHPGFRFAYSRPGLVTWRAENAVPPDFALGAVFARAFGISIGKAATPGEVIDLARALRGSETPPAGEPLVLHVFERDRPEPPEAETTVGVLAKAVRAELLAAAPAGLFVTAERLPRRGEAVLDVIVAPDEALWVGHHVHGDAHSPFAGGRAEVTLPPEAPSRAYLKLEEGLSWSRLPMKRGQVAVEIGSAPGGASWALLQRGLTVIGVDPGAMAEQVLASKNFTHLQIPLGELRREQLPPRVDWLLIDVNLAPQVALHGVRRIVATLRGTLRGVLFTLKLNEWKLAEAVPELLARVAGMGLCEVRATQLVSNRREICVTAVTPRLAAARLPHRYHDSGAAD